MVTTWSKNNLACHYGSFAVFLFAALALAVPSGYTYGAVLLFIAGLTEVWRQRAWRGLNREDWLVVFALVFFGAIWCLEVILDQQGLRGFDKPVRFFAAAVALLFLLRFPPRAGYFWAGLATGGLLAGILAGWQKLLLGYGRAGGHTNEIQFGNISLLLGLLCLAGLIWGIRQQPRWPWLIFLPIGAVSGLAGSFFSGSRGGWLVLPLALLVFCRGLSERFKWGYLGVGIIILALLFVFVYQLPQLGVKKRVETASTELHDYLDAGKMHESVGHRLELWQNAWLLAREKPLLGLGLNGYETRMVEMVAAGKADSAIVMYNHPHNDYLDKLVKRGILGLVSLLILYLLPLWLFWQGLKQSLPEVRAYATAGAMLTVTYPGFGLTQAFLGHNSGVMVYSFMLVIIWAYYRQALSTVNRQEEV